MSEIDKKEFKNLMTKARNLYIDAQDAQEYIFKYLNDELPNIELDEIPIEAVNSDTVKEAICCYLHYGEDSIDNIWKGLKCIKVEE